MAGSTYLPRALEAVLRRRLESFPVVVLTGARQTGKSTLARRLDSRKYLTLDRFEVLEQAREAPEQLLARAPWLTLDEIQRVPDLLLAIKVAVDEDRTPGRFLLTGSANLLLMERVSESLAGRAVYLNLRPLTLGELRGETRAGDWDHFFDEPQDRWLSALRPEHDHGIPDWRRIVRRGGYPVPAHEMEDPENREAWFDGYVQTYLERDLQELSSIDNLVGFRRLMKAACLRLGGLLNQAELARDVGLPSTTAQRYLDLLETSFQLHRLPSFAVNRTKRLVKSPKAYWTDTALALHLGGESEPRGPHLENLILTDLLAWSDGQPNRPQVLFWRTSKGQEVDFVVEWGDRLLPLEVKSGTRARPGDARHLEVFLDEYPDRADGALLLYAGEEAFQLTERVTALPWWWVL